MTRKEKMKANTIGDTRGDVELETLLCSGLHPTLGVGLGISLGGS